MTPPRSMSAISTTGRSAASAKPMLAMSPARRLTSAGLPAPSTTINSAPAERRAKLSSTRGSRCPFIAWYSRALALPTTRPCTTTWAPTSPSGLSSPRSLSASGSIPQARPTPTWAPPSLCGFSSTGFISVVGAIPQARACSAWARPISPPSAVTAALFDMFCGLNGLTARPRRAKARQSPAASSDLPTSDPVPCSMMAGAKVKARVPDSKLYSLLRAHVLLAEGMLHLSHLGHQVGRVDEFRLGVAAGHDDVQHLRALAEKVHHLAERQVVVAQRNVDLVEQDHVVGATLFGIKGAAAGVDHLLGGLPGRRGGGDVARAVLGIPGEALAHRLDGHLIAEALQRGALAGLPLALPELHDADPHAVAQRAEHQAEGSRRLALALAGLDDEEPLPLRPAARLGGK